MSMINKKLFEDDLIAGMQSELRKQASEKTPDLTKAADCLHAALEIFEQAGLSARADDVLKVLQKFAAGGKQHVVLEMPSMQKLMEAGMTQRDLMEFTKGSPVAKAKINLVLRGMGLSEHQIGKFIGPGSVMSEKDAKEMLDPNRSFSKMWDWMKDPSAPVDPASPQPGESLEFKSIAQKKSPVDKHTKGLTPEKMVANLKNHGTEFNMSVDVPLRKGPLTKDDMDVDFADILDSDTFDIDASDDELMGMEIKEDSLEVFDNGDAMSDFEDERD